MYGRRKRWLTANWAPRQLLLERRLGFSFLQGGSRAGTATRPAKSDRLRPASAMNQSATKESVSHAIVERGRSGGSRHPVPSFARGMSARISEGRLSRRPRAEPAGHQGDRPIVPARPAGRPTCPGRDDARCGSRRESSPYDPPFSLPTNSQFLRSMAIRRSRVPRPGCRSTSAPPARRVETHPPGCGAIAGCDRHAAR